MPDFKGFSEGKSHQVPIPSQFFRELFPSIDHLGELKVTLYIFWRMDRMESAFRFVRWTDLVNDETLLNGLGGKPAESLEILGQGLARAVQRGSLLEAMVSTEQAEEKIYFLNSPKGRAALRAIESGQWRPIDTNSEIPLDIEEPINIFQLYEENIGPLAPMIADALVEAEQTYPLPWIEEAIGISVQNNKRNWRYIVAILERWRREGKHGKKEKPEDRSDTETARRRYVEGEFSDFIEH